MNSGTAASRVQAVETHDVLVIGSGVGGLTVALETPGRGVGLLTKTELGHGGSSPMAQGGVAVAIGPGDSPAAHAEDTLAAGVGLAVPERVRILTEEGPARIAALLALGTRFDRDGAGHLAQGREAAHGCARILHADGDATGAEIVRALREAVEAAPAVEVFEHTFACELVMEQGRVVGALARHAADAVVLHLARAVVLATGGIGHVYRYTTNPRDNTGDGLAMAARAGARLADLEFVQFHPTALDVGTDPMPLVTEALRGGIKEGKQATHWTRLSCHRFRANEVRLQLSVLAYNLGNLWRRLVLPPRVKRWSLTSLQQRLMKTGAISEFPKWRKYLISLSFRGQSSVRPVQVGGFDVNIVIHRSTAVRGRGGPARHDAWPPSLGAILAHTDGPCGS